MMSDKPLVFLPYDAPSEPSRRLIIPLVSHSSSSSSEIDMGDGIPSPPGAAFHEPRPRQTGQVVTRSAPPRFYGISPSEMPISYSLRHLRTSHPIIVRNNDPADVPWREHLRNEEDRRLYQPSSFSIASSQQDFNTAWWCRNAIYVAFVLFLSVGIAIVPSVYTAKSLLQVDDGWVAIKQHASYVGLVWGTGSLIVFVVLLTIFLAVNGPKWYESWQRQRAYQRILGLNEPMTPPLMPPPRRPPTTSTPLVH